MYYVRYPSNTLSNALSQNKETFKTTKKNPTLLKKSKMLTKKDTKDKKPFSMLDVDIKKVSNGTKMEKQYVREEKSKVNDTNHPFNKFNETFEKDNQAFKTSTGFYKTKEERLPHMQESEMKRGITTPMNSSHQNIHSLQGNNIKEINEEYVRRIYTSHANRQESHRKAKDIKDKMRASDPFFQKGTDVSNEGFVKQRERNLVSSKPNYYRSDIFNSKEFDLFKDKSIDKFIIANPIAKGFTSTSPSRSEWSPKNSKINLFNHTSVPYSVLNSNMKSFVKTKEEIYQDHNGSPANRQKALCEFIDLARVSTANPNKEYLNAFNSSSRAFHKSSNICSNYQDLHRMYGSLCERPFVKKIV